MPSTPLRICALLATFLSLGGCATAPRIIPPEVPAALRPPPGEQLYLEARASGVQIYECTATSDRPAKYEWIFRAPEAALLDPAGHPLGRHYAGPTWESTDGSTVVADVRARDPGPNADAIPWLLLGARTTTRSGTFSKTTSIQRVQTVGGLAPSEPCTGALTAKIARIPYTATYYFYRAHG